MAARRLTNPYLVGPPVTGTHGFYGRQDLVGDVVNTLTNAQQNAIVLHGQRRIGKSSLLHRLRRDDTLQQDYLPIIFDMQLYEGFPLARILHSLARMILDELMLDLPIPTEEKLAATPRQFQRTFLPQIYSHLNHKRILILFDEFDVAVPATLASAASADTVLGYLRTLITEEQAPLAFVFVVGQRLELLGEGYRRLFKGAHAQRVGRLKQTETSNLLTELGQQVQITYADNALAEVWALTNGHPYLTQLIGFEVFEQLQKENGQQVSAAHVEACLETAMEHGQGALDWFWRGFEAEQQWVLSAVADLTNRQKSISSTEINKALEQHLLFLTPLQLDNAYQQLLEGDFLIQTDRNHYQFAVEFIRRWIVKYHPLKEIQLEIERVSPEALNYYQLGRHAFGKGNLDEAIDNYRKALARNPHFTRVYLDLAVALRAQGQIEAAIDECEKAYQRDPATAREALMEFRLTYANQLISAGDNEAGLAQAWRILEINSEHADARQLISRIFLDRVRAHLADHKLAEAWGLVQQLVQPVPIIQDAEVGQQVREMWLNYSQELSQQEPSHWEEARQVLADLGSIGLLDETVITAFNQVTLNEAQVLLLKDDLNLTLTSLQTKLKAPLPADHIKSLLLDYSDRQVKQRNWTQADQTLSGLRQLVDDKDSQDAQVRLYHEWGDALLNKKAFDEAIAVYSRGKMREFRPKVTQGHLRQAAWQLTRNELVEAETSYRSALATQNTPATREEAQRDLKAYLDGQQQQQAWPEAEGALRILEALDLAGNEGSVWQISLQLDQARAELAHDDLDAAFQRMTALGEESRADIKTMIRSYVRQKARSSDWKTGVAALERLSHLFTQDPETSSWHANGLFLWAQALVPNGKATPESAQAKKLCQKILKDAPAETSLLDLLTETEVPVEKEAGGLRRNVCDLATHIALIQAQNYLSQNNLDQAEKLFKETLSLPIPPDNLTADIQARLQSYSESQRLKEEWELAQRALDMIKRLGIVDTTPEVIRDALRQAHLMFKGDQPTLGFGIINSLKAVEDAERQEIRTMAYQFSRLYAGRDRWAEAKQVLESLRRWLGQAKAAQEIAHAIDVLNRERLDFVKGKHLSSKPVVAPPEGFERLIEHLKEEVLVVGEGYEDAKAPELKLDTLDTWAEEFIKASLDLGRVCLAHNDLAAAADIFQKALNIKCQNFNPNDQISQSLRNYSERMLYQENWDEARRALENLKNLNLPAPNGHTRPDPLVDGAIQRVILAHAQALLQKDQVAETFAQLQLLPRPWPEGDVKAITFEYSQERRNHRKGWPNAILALKQLDEFLAGDRQEVRAQDALEWLVDGLEQWGQHLEAEGKLTEATRPYAEALTYTRQAARPRNLELAAHYIRVALELAQVFLNADSLKPEVPTELEQAMQWYQNILHLPEHQPEDEDQINQDLYKHTFKLAEARQWERANQLLDYLDVFYPTPPDNYKTLFATWRQELALHEGHRWLAELQLEPAFARLEKLKEWLNARNAPQATWQDYEGQIKSQIYQDFCQPWLGSGSWELTGQALENLGRLVPADGEIIGWQVEALSQWARTLQEQNHLAEAIIRYQEALEKVPGQQTISAEDIEPDLLQAQLDYAQEHLNQNDLANALVIYTQVLVKPADYLDRADKIRQALKVYSDRLPPDWPSAQQALDSLQDLNLKNDEVFEWRQDLTLQKMEAELGQDDLKTAFDSLDTVEAPWPLSKIQALIHKYSTTRAESDQTWKLAIDALEILGRRINGDDSARQWVAAELITLGNTLRTRGNLPGAEHAFDRAIELQ